MSARRRSSGIGLAIACNLLVFLVLMGLGAAQFKGKPDDALVVDLMPAPPAQAPPAAKAETVTQSEKPKSRPIKPPIQIPIAKPLPMLLMTKEEYAAADIRNLGHADTEGLH